jgi:1-deoxy-D-xylulose-5-phosphate synthase
MRFVKPMDRDAVLRVALKSRALVTIEENVVAGGAGSAVGETLAEGGVQIPLLNIGIPDRFIEHGSREDCLAMAGLDAASIRQRISEWWHGLLAGPLAADGRT